MTKTQINAASILASVAIGLLVVLVGVMTALNVQASPLRTPQPVVPAVQGQTLDPSIFDLHECQSTLPLGGC